MKISMLKFIFACFTLCFSINSLAEAPKYFNKVINDEYISILKHFKQMLPATKLELAYLPSFYPFAIMDLRATNFESNEDKQSFANFNYGVLGRAYLNISEQQQIQLLNTVICKHDKCEKQRFEIINPFLDNAKTELSNLIKQRDIEIVQQTSEDVFRINNSFFSHEEVLQYSPSRAAGFIPSAEFKITPLNEAPADLLLASKTQVLRNKMTEFNVAAITRVNGNSLNIIFGGLGDNHWGIMMNYLEKLPEPGEYNHLGLEYEIIKKINQTMFYYQTN